MPTCWTLRLNATAGVLRPASPGQLHGLVCALFEGAGAEHLGQIKPFAVSPLLAAADLAAGFTELRVGWLDDSRPVDLGPLIGRRVRLGAQFLTVVGAERQAASYAVLRDGRPARRVELGFLSPTYFSRGGRWIPLPDPELVYGGLIRRWNHFAPDPVGVSEGKALLESLLLSAHDIATQPVDLGRGIRIGFTGDAALALAHAAGEQTARLFSALTYFATVAGVGAQTTHGLGHVRAAVADSASGAAAS